MILTADGAGSGGAPVALLALPVLFAAAMTLGDSANAAVMLGELLMCGLDVGGSAALDLPIGPVTQQWWSRRSSRVRVRSTRSPRRYSTPAQARRTLTIARQSALLAIGCGLSGLAQLPWSLILALVESLSR